MREIEKCLSIVALRVVNSSFVFGGKRVQQIKSTVNVTKFEACNTHNLQKRYRKSNSSSDSQKFTL